MSDQDFVARIDAAHSHASDLHAAYPLLAAIRMQCDAIDAQPRSTDFVIVGALFGVIAIAHLTSRVRRGRRSR